MGLTYIEEQVVDNERNHGVSLHSDYALFVFYLCDTTAALLVSD